MLQVLFPVALTANFLAAVTNTFAVCAKMSAVAAYRNALALAKFPAAIQLTLAKSTNQTSWSHLVSYLDSFLATLLLVLEIASKNLTVSVKDLLYHLTR